METVFIADDEQIIRNGLKCIIDWNELGFEICGEASNGEDALNKILQLNPSLVLIDIRMPKLHGIDVIEASRKQGFKGKIIIISGFSDFKYAQSAIRFGVDYYLTKPIDEEELLDIIKQVKESISNEKKTSQVLLHYKEKAKKEILDDLISGTADISLINTSEINISANIYQVVIYEQFIRNLEEMPYQFADLLRVTNNGNFTFEHFTKDGKEVVILKGSYALDKFQRFLDHYQSTPPQKNSPLDSLFLAYGCPVKDVSDIRISYSRDRQLIERRFFCTHGQHTLGYNTLPDIQVKLFELNNEQLNNYCATISNYIQAFNRKMIADTLTDLSEYLFNVQDSIDAIKLFITDMLLQIKENMSRLYSIGTSTRDSILDDILYYIDHNYQTTIKLESIAPLFGYNSAYLGKIFSKTVGENFNNYVDHIRISHAKELILENKLKVYEIAEQVGYKNVDYFHKKFKKYVGQSPAEFRKANVEDTE